MKKHAQFVIARRYPLGAAEAIQKAFFWIAASLVSLAPRNDRKIDVNSITNQHRKVKTMRISQINQQMNTNKMNQNASVNRSNSTSQMLNPSFGTIVEPKAMTKIIEWLEACPQDFVEKHAKDLAKRLKRLKKDGFADVISLKEIKKDIWGNCGSGWYVCGWEANYFPKLNIKNDKHKKLAQAMSRTPIRKESQYKHEPINFKLTEEFEKFLKDLTPEEVAKYRAKAIEKADKALAKKVAAKPKGTGKAKAESGKKEMLRGLRQFAG